MAEQIKNMNVVPEIVIDDGSVKIPIRNTHGDELGVFYFRPTDVGMITRFNEIVDSLDEIVAPLEHISINADGTADADNPKEAEALREAEKRMREACDYLFGGNMYDAFFGKTNPFSPVNGAFYCEQALEAVGKFISAQFEEETRKINKRVGRYTQGYKGKRRA